MPQLGGKAPGTAQGFAFNDGGIVSEMAAVAVPVFGPEQTVAAALSIAAIRQRMTAERIKSLTKSLKREAEALGVLLHAREPSERSKHE